MMLNYQGAFVRDRKGELTKLTLDEKKAVLVKEIDDLVVYKDD